MTIIIRDYQSGEQIPDAFDVKSYTYEELDGALYVQSDDITGDETYQLTNGKTVVLQSIDLEWVRPFEEKILRTTSFEKGN